MDCDCQDWKDNIAKVNEPYIREAARTGAVGYRGKTFVFCPWCAKRLEERPVATPNKSQNDFQNKAA